MPAVANPADMAIDARIAASQPHGPVARVRLGKLDSSNLPAKTSCTQMHQAFFSRATAEHGCQPINSAD